MTNKEMIKKVKSELKKYKELKVQIEELGNSIIDETLPIQTDKRIKRSEVQAAQTILILLTDCICECEASLDDLAGGQS